MPHIEIVAIPSLCDTERLKRMHDRARAEISEILTPEGLSKLDAAQDDFEHRVLFGADGP